jgi:potassium-transporting ATPase KdpC subunit
MKKLLWSSIKLTVLLILLCCVLYPVVIAGIAKLAPGGGSGEKVMVNGKVVGYKNIGQLFTSGKYFQGRPSAVNYNAAGSAGSNKGPSNEDYLKLVRERIDSFKAHNPGEPIPVEMVTASGSGLDPDITPAAAMAQVKRIARERQLPENIVRELVNDHTEKSWFAPEKVNVLLLNIELDKIR